MAKKSDAVAVLGAGSFGTALAVHLARLERPTTLWGRNAAHLKHLGEARENTEYLPGVRFPQTLQITADLMTAVAKARDIVIVVPSHALHEVLDELKPLLKD